MSAYAVDYGTPTPNENTTQRERDVPPVRRKKRKTERTPEEGPRGIKLDLTETQRAYLGRRGLIIRQTNQLKTCNAMRSEICVVELGTETEHLEVFIKNGAIGIPLGLKVGSQIYINRNQLIAKGSFGEIFSLVNVNNTKDRYVIKTFEEIKDYLHEKIVSILVHNFQSSISDPANLVPSYWYENEGTNIIIMRGEDQDLSHLIANYHFNPINIFLQVLNSIYQLYLAGIYYCDLKDKNILYRINDLGKVEITIADIGGLFFTKNHINSNLLSSEDLNETFFTFKNHNDSNFLKVYISDNFIGYCEIDRKLHSVLTEEGKQFEIINLGGVRSLINKDVVVQTDLKLIFEGCGFTYPHVKNNGYIHIDPNSSNEEIRNLLMNNIFQSLGALLIGLYFRDIKTYDEFSHSNISKIRDNFDKTISKLRDEIENETIKSILFDYLIKEDYTDYNENTVVISTFESLKKLCISLLS